MYVCIYIYMYVRMYVRVYIYIYIYIHTVAAARLAAAYLKLMINSALNRSIIVIVKVQVIIVVIVTVAVIVIVIETVALRRCIDASVTARLSAAGYRNYAFGRGAGHSWVGANVY